jgi:soluble lytic murein transglycosylase-like protein
VFNANDNMRGGIRYFSEMLMHFGQDVELVLAAYNAGPGTVEKYKGIPPYAETQNYVKRVLGYYERYAALKP